MEIREGTEMKQKFGEVNRGVEEEKTGDETEVWRSKDRLDCLKTK